MVAGYGLKADAAVVDLGSGTGNLAAHIATNIVPQGRVLGFDKHSGMVAYAKEKHKDIPNLEFHENFFDALPDNSVDYIFAIYSYCWVKKLGGSDGIKAIMQESARVLKPGGHLEARFTIKHTDEHPVAFFQSVQDVATSKKWAQFYEGSVVLANDLDICDYEAALDEAGLHHAVYIEKLLPHACSCALMTKGLLSLPIAQLIPQDRQQEFFDDIAQALEKYAEKNEAGEFLLTGKPCVIKAFKSVP